ncbi:hypothetical protein [Schlesneria paludicola]|uniref:hypothetical protein n=1 Tax=Schlesneria paludicola TaxID=360056 RepID=UPI00029AC909|nr:hypothetical protein [Schlesneria paludicola]
MFQAFRWPSIVTSVVLVMASAVAQSDDKYKLEEPVDDIRVFGVGTRVDVSGKVQPVPKGVQLAQTVSAVISYRERRMLGPGSEAEAFRSVREYETAQADTDFDGNKSQMRLPDSLMLMVAQGRHEGVELRSIQGLLTSDELDLIRSPADSLALIALLPPNEVAVGDKWTVPSWAFQMLTALDAIAKGELVCTLDSVDKGIAKIKMNGTLEGAAVASSTEVKVTGFFKYNLEGKYISETDFVQTELRAFGPISPGLDITARVRLLRVPSKPPGRLGDQKIVDLASPEPTPAAMLLKFESPWNISLQHNRHWHFFRVEEGVAKFRLLEEGNFIAQFDMAPVAQAKPGEHKSIEVFQADVRKAIGDLLKTLEQGQVIPSTDGKFVYRVTAKGAVKDRDITWICYLVADPTGRQASLMFIADTPLVEKITRYERELIESIRFGPAPPPRAANK